jgi:hypothetical protein
MTVLVTKWSRIVSDYISEYVGNPPSNRFFQTRHNVRILIDSEGYAGVSERRLDDRFPQASSVKFEKVG